MREILPVKIDRTITGGPRHLQKQSSDSRPHHPFSLITTWPYKGPWLWAQGHMSVKGEHRSYTQGDGERVHVSSPLDPSQPDSSDAGHAWCWRMGWDGGRAGNRSSCFWMRRSTILCYYYMLGPMLSTLQRTSCSPYVDNGPGNTPVSQVKTLKPEWI